MKNGWKASDFNNSKRENRNKINSRRRKERRKRIGHEEEIEDNNNSDKANDDDIQFEPILLKIWINTTMKMNQIPLTL